MAEVNSLNPIQSYKSEFPQQPNSTQKDIEKKIVLKDPFQKKEEMEVQKISTEELMKSLIKPKEIKRLLYLVIPFTRHFISEMDQKKGMFIDKET
ncbi:MAG: hypothetical protein ACK4UJ_09125 [Leptonema sp. (in: bacteria)]